MCWGLERLKLNPNPTYTWLARQVLCSLAPVPAAQALTWLQPPVASSGRHAPLGQPTAAADGLARRSASIAASTGHTGGVGGVTVAPGGAAAGGAAAGDMLAATQARWQLFHLSCL